MCEQGFQQRGLARAGRAHHVDAEDAGGVQPGAILGGELVVGFEDFLGGDDFHGGSILPTSMLCSISSRPPSMVMSLLPHRGHWTTRSSISVRALQAWQQQTAFGSWITISAFSTGVPGASRPKAKRTESQLTPESRPMLSSSRKHAARLAGPIQFPSHLVDQRLDDGKFVHDSDE